MDYFVGAREILFHLPKVHPHVFVDHLLDEEFDVALFCQVQYQHTNDITDFIQERLITFVEDRPRLLLLHYVDFHKGSDDEAVEFVVGGEFGLFVDQLEHVLEVVV